ncbi:cellulase family glycosylhydrolase [Demequina aurantiaca]|uniref:glycoside hydrolase family 5 protein n=1 Tax=Demequina aurantiaca TaxID=676200 RepID=UPI003D32E300
MNQELDGRRPPLSTGRNRRAQPWIIAAGVTVVALAAGATLVAANASAVDGCSAELTIAQSWPEGYIARVQVAGGADGVDGWTVAVGLGDSTVESAWNSTLAAGATGDSNASDVGRNAVLASGEVTEWGFQSVGAAPAAGPLECNGELAVANTSDPSVTPDSDPASAPSLTPQPSATPEPTQSPDGFEPSESNDDWLHTDGNTIVDSQGNPVWLTGANWFGFNTTERVLHGLWTANLNDTVDQISAHGFNVLRVPISTELLLEWKNGQAAVASGINTHANPELEGLTTLGVFDAFLAASKDAGVKVILDVHSAAADNAGHVAPMWYSGSITTEDFYDAWVWTAERYKNDDTIIGYDLENEPHGTFQDSPRAKWDGSTDPDNWKYVAQTIANKILAINPNVLILVEGIETYPKDGKSWDSTDGGDYYSNWWGGNLRGVADHDLDLGSDQDQLVYSPHEYGPLVYEQPWFTGEFSQASLTEDVWGPNWLYLHDNDQYPLLIGEWGGRIGEDQRQDDWMLYLRNLIAEKKINHTFWTVNPNSADTGGLLLDDWATWDQEKLALLDPALWQDSEGDFVGLDHVVPLIDGTNVTEYYENGNAAPVGR